MEKSHLSAGDVQDLEDHLRDGMEELQKVGLSEDEAFLIAVRRMGSSTALAGELAQVDSDRTWKQLSRPDAPPEPENRIEVVWVVLGTLIAAALGKLPLLFGIGLDGAGTAVYLRNTALFTLPVLTLGYYFARRFHSGLLGLIGLAFLAAASAINLYPFRSEGSTFFLAVLHLPLLLWLVFGLAYTSGEWRTTRSVWDFIRFSGEFVIYCVLLGLGGLVLLGLTTVFFEALGLPAEDFIMEWVGYSGLLGLPVVAAYLVEKKRSLIENIAPVLARIFIPMFLVVTVAFIAAALTRLPAFVQDRNLLITVDGLLALVTGMVLYDLSARDPEAPFTGGDLMSLLLMGAALVIDVMALSGIVGRLSQFGFSPNKVAALGENILLLVNLAGLLVGYVRFRWGGGTRKSILAWQVWCMPAYLLWLAWVVFALPPIYRFV